MPNMVYPIFEEVEPDEWECEVLARFDRGEVEFTSADDFWKELGLDKEES